MTIKKDLTFIAFFLFASLMARAQSGTLTTYVMTWNSIGREYGVYVPPVLQSTPPLIVALHPTQGAPQTQPPLTYFKTWFPYADRYGFLVVLPVSTWNPIKGQWYWDACAMDSLFPVAPDDNGFIRKVIQTVAQQYSVDSSRIGVMGLSSGAFMAHCAGITSSDIVAAIAPISGAVWAQATTLPNISAPVSVLEYHGDADTTIPYCGGNTKAWNGISVPVASVDQSIDYWLAEDSLPAKLNALCVGGLPSTVYFVDAAVNGVQVTFLREIRYGHAIDTSLEQAIYQFVLSHPKPQGARAR